jgi:hypothetical protein
MFARRPFLERHGIQNVLIAVALAIAVMMLAPPLSPVLDDADSLLPFVRTGGAASESNDPLEVTFLTLSDEPAVERSPVEAKGILMTGYTAGGSRFAELVKLIEETELNSVVIDIKDERGEISWVPRTPEVAVGAAGLPKIEDPAATLEYLKDRGIYVIGRLVTFQDPIMASKRPDLAIQDNQGGTWENNRGLSWLDPYSTEAQDYNIALAIEAVELGFDEIQFDYVRFPTDGDISRLWHRHHDGRLPRVVIADFLRRAKEQIVPRGAFTSADLFGLVALVQDDLGIGQRLELMARHVDYVSLMLYPSHFNKPEYGIEDPELEPGEIVRRSLRDAKARLEGTGAKLRPWLQDFTMRVPYTPKEVRDQIDATEGEGIGEWLLWNVRNRYTSDALRPAEGVGPPPRAGNSSVDR